MGGIILPSTVVLYTLESLLVVDLVAGVLLNGGRQPSVLFFWRILVPRAEKGWLQSILRVWLLRWWCMVGASYFLIEIGCDMD